MPHHFGLLKRQKARPKFYDFDQYAWLLEAAAKIDPRIYLVALLGGDAGCRRGEIQKLAGHKNLQTTLGFMHLASGETERAIRPLEVDMQGYGNLTATDASSDRNVAV